MSRAGSSRDAESAQPERTGSIPGAGSPGPNPIGWSTALPALLVIVCGWFAFSSALHGGWLWDDRYDVVSNPLLRDPAGLRTIWFNPTALTDYYPIKATVQWLQWHLWGEQTTGYHVTNVLLHLWGAFLFWRVLRQLGLRLGWLGALAFAVHPIMVESVAWIAELKNTLSLPPLLWAFSRFITYTRTNRRADYLASLLLFLAAMLSKTSVVMFPVTLLLFWWWQHGRVTLRAAKVTLPFFAISAVLGLLTVWLQQERAIGDELIPLGGAGERIVRAGVALAFYAWKCLWPASLMPIYPAWPVDVRSLVQWLPWPALLLACGWFYRRRHTWGRHALLGAGWFVLHLLPFLGFVPISYFRFTWVMDHFVYVAILGVIGLGVATLEAVSRLLVPWQQRIAVIVCAGGAIVFATVSHGYAAFYRDAIALWTFAARMNPQAWVAHNNLGLALAGRGRVDAALASYDAALRLKPDYVEARNNLGNVLLQLGRNDAAAAQFARVLESKPGYAAAHNNHGVALRRLGRTSEAITHFETARRLNPDYAEASLNLGNALVDTGEVAQAVRHYEDAVRLAPGFAEAHFNLALALKEIGRTDEAREHYAAARRLNPAMPEIPF